MNLVDSPAAFQEMPEKEQRQLLSWIADSLTPGTEYCTAFTSYGLKHLYQGITSAYVTNGEFKGAMLAAGYVPKDPEAQNWVFKIIRPVTAATEAGFVGYL